MRVLLVEDSVRLRTYVSKALRQHGYAVDEVDNGQDALWMAQSRSYDAIVLDWMLPGLDGISVLRKIRAEGNQVHVLVLTAKDAVDSRVEGLDAGADDYLVKPFAMAELVARVQALCRRTHGQKSNQLEIGRLLIDLAQRTAYVEGELIELSPRQFAILEYLALRKDEVVSRTEIEQHIYDENAEPMSNVVDAAICYLRKKIDVKGDRSLIVTRRGVGYMLRSEEE